MELREEVYSVFLQDCSVPFFSRNARRRLLHYKFKPKMKRSAFNEHKETHLVLWLLNVPHSAMECNKFFAGGEKKLALTL